MTGHEAHIPWGELVVPQMVNFVLFVGVLIYFLRKPVKEHFLTKRQEFEEQRKKAEEAKVLAERKNFEIQSRLEKLEKEAVKNLEDAKKEAQSLKAKLVAESYVTAARIESEAGKMVEFEKYRVIAALRTELVTSSMRQASEHLNSRVDKKVKIQLNQDFINKMQAAQS